MTPDVRRFLRQPWLRELLLVALLFKALIPTGYMPDMGSDGVPSLKLCAFVVTAGPASDAPSPSSGGSEEQGDHALQGLCPQALSLLPALASPAALTYVPIRAPVRLALAGTDTHVFYRSPTPHSRLPRGPPAPV